jgi:phage shock protein PspC (stress-responsive transcriptional regulator)
MGGGRGALGAHRGHPPWCEAMPSAIIVGMNSTPSPTSRPDRLTRSTTDRKIGGVAGGLAAYLGVDPVLVRLGFAITTLFSGAGLVAYIAMHLLVPADDELPAVAYPATS